MIEALKTTRPVRSVRTIDDILAIEAHAYDELVTARNLYDLFRATAALHGDDPALTVLRSPDPGDVGVHHSHRELLAEITRAANMFRALGVTEEDGVVAFLAPTLPQLPALLLAAQVAGIASSLNYLLSEDAIVDLLNAQGATVLVTASRTADEACWNKATGLMRRVPTLRHVLVMDGAADGESGFLAIEDVLAEHDASCLTFEPTNDRHRVCALFHTGGTTGRPKLVQLTHGNQIHAAFAFAQVFGYDRGDVVINGFPFFHVGGTMTVGLSVLAANAHMVVPSPYALRPPQVIENYWDIVRHYGATVVDGVPTSLGALTASFPAGMDVSKVRMAATGGAVCPKAVTQRFEAVTGIRVFETYGMTETAAAIAFNPGRGEPLAGSVGFRAPFSTTRIVSATEGDVVVCGPNESGIVQVSGPQVFPGYLDPAHNRGTLSADGWLTTGDIGYLTQDERLVLTGREKDLIVRSGHNIDPAAIEDVANQFEGVEISAAVGMPDQYAGEVPTLFVVPKKGANLDLDALQRYLEDHIFEPPARPRRVLPIEALPVTAVGKIFKPTLRDMAIQEKVRMEVEKACRTAAGLEVNISLDAQKRTVVDVVVPGAAMPELVAIEEALRPLPQTYAVTGRPQR